MKPQSALPKWFCLLALLLFARQVYALGWSERATMALPRQEVAVAELDGRVYVIGGFRQDASIADTVEVYDTETDSWSLAAPFPVPVHHAAAINVNGKLYVIGGCREPFVPMSTLFVYEPLADSWQPRAAMPNPRCSLAVAAIDGKIYAAGGSPPVREHDFTVYDPALDQWSVLADMPTGRNHLAAAAVAGKFYAIGGRSGGIENVLDAVEEYDPVAASWTSKTAMPTARGGVAAAGSAQAIVVFGGEGNVQHPAGIFEAVEAYDAINDQWRALPPMPVPRHGIAAASLGDAVYIPGGASNQGLGVSDVHEVFDMAGIERFAGVFCDVSVNRQTYVTGEDVIATRIRIGNLAAGPVSVEIKSWYDRLLPATETAVLNIGPTGLLSLPPGVDFDLSPVTLFSVTAETEPGEYRLGCRTLSPVSGEASALKLDAFEVDVP